MVFCVNTQQFQIHRIQLVSKDWTQKCKTAFHINCARPRELCSEHHSELRSSQHTLHYHTALLRMLFIIRLGMNRIEITCDLREQIKLFLLEHDFISKGIVRLQHLDEESIILEQQYDLY